jgi:hypothetical protein
MPVPDGPEPEAQLRGPESSLLLSDDERTPIFSESVGPVSFNSWILLDLEFHIMVEVGKPGRDGAARPSTAHHQDPHATTEQFTVNCVSFHGSLLLATVNKLPQGLSRVRQKFSRKSIFTVR